MKSMIEHEYGTDQARWDAVVERDHEASEAFVYGVLTTLVYCRPGCSSRTPKRENVRFFADWRQAEQAGFRPCKRCRPQSASESDRRTALMVKACELMENSEEPLRLKDLAGEVGLGPHHFQRLFKKIIGVTPKQYAMEHRLKRVRSSLEKDSSVTDAIYEAGFASSSRFYENVQGALGMKPSQYRNGGEGIGVRVAVERSYLGWVLIAATEQGICAIELGDDPEALKTRFYERFPHARVQTGDETFREWTREVLAHIEQPRLPLDLPLDIQGTAFQRKVWTALREIEPGDTTTYSDLAAKIGRPTAARAVARACATNIIAVGIPCHRVVRRDGDLGGYRWGLEKKRALLEHEAGER